MDWIDYDVFEKQRVNLVILEKRIEYKNKKKVFKDKL